MDARSDLLNWPNSASSACVDRIPIHPERKLLVTSMKAYHFKVSPLCWQRQQHLKGEKNKKINALWWEPNTLKSFMKRTAHSTQLRKVPCARESSPDNFMRGDSGKFCVKQKKEQPGKWALRWHALQKVVRLTRVRGGIFWCIPCNQLQTYCYLRELVDWMKCHQI